MTGFFYGASIMYLSVAAASFWWFMYSHDARFDATTGPHTTTRIATRAIVTTGSNGTDGDVGLCFSVEAVGGMVGQARG
jgi:hypothetical protein